jgi:hypothetical protein
LRSFMGPFFTLQRPPGTLYCNIWNALPVESCTRLSLNAMTILSLLYFGCGGVGGWVFIHLWVWCHWDWHGFRSISLGQIQPLWDQGEGWSQGHRLQDQCSVLGPSEAWHFGSKVRPLVTEKRVTILGTKNPNIRVWILKILVWHCSLGSEASKNPDFCGRLHVSLIDRCCSIVWHHMLLTVAAKGLKEKCTLRTVFAVCETCQSINCTGKHWSNFESFEWVSLLVCSLNSQGTQQPITAGRLMSQWGFQCQLSWNSWQDIVSSVQYAVDCGPLQPESSELYFLMGLGLCKFNWNGFWKVFVQPGSSQCLWGTKSSQAMMS